MRTKSRYPKETNLKKIFISRRVKKGSFFYKKIKESGFDLDAKSLLSFRQVAFNKIPEIDWIFFYSQKGVHYFFKNINKKKIALSKQIRFAGFGKITAKVIESQGVECGFIGTGHAQTTAEAFAKIANKQTILFPRAKHSQRSVQVLLENKIEMLDLVVYNNFPKKNMELSDYDMLIFTSPMNAQAYFQKNKIKKGQQFYAIGQTTAKALKGLGVKKVFVPKNPSMEEIAKLVILNNVEPK